MELSCEPDFVIDGNFALEPYGVPGGVVMHTPEHTAGSVLALLSNGDMLAGNLGDWQPARFSVASYGWATPENFLLKMTCE